MLARRVPVSIGETLERDGFIYTDLVPAFAFERPARRN
jgi:hypothetical protein